MQQIHAQANTKLSNLVAPTQVNVHLLPNTTNTRNLGNNNKRWKDIHMNGIIRRGGYTWIAGDPFSNNTFVGQSAGNYLINNGEGGSNDNTFIGSYAGFSNTTGLANTFAGTSAGYYNTTGTQNTFMGWAAGGDNTVGGSNTFLGVWAGTRNTSGRENVMIGKVAGGFNKTGNYNVYVGNLSGYLGSAGSYNTFVGDSAGMENTASNNTMIGSKSGLSNTSGLGNTFVGSQAAIENTTGSYNTAIGYFSLDENGTAAGNTALGYSTGTLFINGSYNTFVGYDADANGSGFTNSTAVGRAARITASNQVRIGNSTVSSIGGYANWSNISDGRFKKNIKENVPGLSFINRLKPVTYNLDINGIESRLSSKKENLDNNAEQSEIAAKEKIIYTGFVAQDVERIAKELKYVFSGVDAPKNDNDLYSLRYAEFVVPLVKAVQELSKMNDEKDAVISQQQQQMDAIMERLENLEKKNGITNNSGMNGPAFVAQNVPNPFSTATVISYSIPGTMRSAKLNITDAQGKAVKTIPLNNRQGNVTIAGNELVAGNYFYELIVDGKRSATRQMMVIE